MKMFIAVWLVWDALLDVDPPVDGYRLYYGPTNPPTSVVWDVGNLTRVEVLNLPSGVTIYFQVRAYNTQGESGPSNTISWVEPQLPTPTPAPTRKPHPHGKPRPTPKSM